MSYELIDLQYEGDFATITMNSPKRRNALSLKHMLELTDAFREVGESKALGMLLTGDTIHAHTAAEWGLINRVVPPEQLVEESQRLLEAATRGSFISKGMGKQAYYTQIDLPQHQAYAYAMEVMAAASQLPDAQEGMQAFLEKRKPNFKQPS